MTAPRIAGAWLTDPATAAVMAALRARGAPAFFVGGCVRNALLGRAVSDIDIATPTHPEEVAALADAAGLRAVPTGIAHGTVTVVADGRGFEVTTFRRDIATDGRRATVAFATDIAEDAARRDFTMNALYAAPDGTVIDPLGGLPDLIARRVRFVGRPAARIAEDYLRILRFFRFSAWYGDPGAPPDPEGLAACISARAGLAGLSRERVGTEIAKLLAAPHPAPALAAMHAGTILALCLPGADPAALPALETLEAAHTLAPHWPRRLAALGWREDWADALRLSRADRRTLTAIAAALAAAAPPEAAAYRHGTQAARDAALIAAARRGDTAYVLPRAAIARGAAARFPLRAADLSLEGPALGAALRQLEDEWIASGFTLTAADLRARAARH